MKDRGTSTGKDSGTPIRTGWGYPLVGTGWGYSPPTPVGTGWGYPPVRKDWGTPLIRKDGVSPCQDWMGYPHQDWLGVSPQLVLDGGLTPPPCLPVRRQSKRASTWYTRGWYASCVHAGEISFYYIRLIRVHGAEFGSLSGESPSGLVCGCSCFLCLYPSLVYHGLHQGQILSVCKPTVHQGQAHSVCKPTIHQGQVHSVCKPTVHQGQVHSVCKPTVHQWQVHSVCKPTIHQGQVHSVCKPTVHQGQVHSACKPTVHQRAGPQCL